MKGSGRAAGMTLIEVTLAVAILSAALAVLLTGASRCLAIIRDAGHYQHAQWVMSLGELEHVVAGLEEARDMEVAPVDYEGYTFEREVEDDDDDDDLYLVRTRVSWNARRGEYREEVNRHLYFVEEK